MPYVRKQLGIIRDEKGNVVDAAVLNPEYKWDHTELMQRMRTGDTLQLVEQRMTDAELAEEARIQQKEADQQQAEQVVGVETPATISPDTPF